MPRLKKNGMYGAAESQGRRERRQLKLWPGNFSFCCFANRLQSSFKRSRFESFLQLNAGARASELPEVLKECRRCTCATRRTNKLIARECQEFISEVTYL
jgi:hypothetical protein